LDFLTKAYTNRPGLNGIPTGVYTADVYVWSTRAKNSVPGYCLGSSMPISPNGVDPFTVAGGPCATSAAVGSSSNPNPWVPVTSGQTFRVTLFVFDTTQVIQITPNGVPNGGLVPGGTFTLFATVANSENLFTGNIIPPFGQGSFPNYPNFGPNGDALVAWSLLPFQTTGAGITGCTSNNVVCATGTNSNSPVPLPAGVTLDKQTLAQYNACTLPTGTFNGAPINGQSVPGLGSLLSTGPSSSTSFTAANPLNNTGVTVYTCRPTVAPAWLNSALYPGNASFPGGPSLYSNGNGPVGTVGNTAQTVTGAVATGPVPSTGPPTTYGLNPGGTPCVGCGASTASKIGINRNGNSFLLDTNGNLAYDSGTDKFIAAFFTTGFNGITSAAGDVAVSGDWTGDGKGKVGFYRPSTGQWFLDANNDGIYDAGDLTYSFGGLTTGGNIDTPVVGDWNNTGKSCIGIYRSNGSVWLLDLNCNGTFDNTPTDAFFPFGGLAGDVPVTGNWTGSGGFKVGVVRAYSPGGVQTGPPFFWVMDAGAANAGNTPANHPPATGAFPFGGVPCTGVAPNFTAGCTTTNPMLTSDIYVTGDWTGTGVSRAGIYRAGNWLLDLSGAHTYDTFAQFGGLASDKPVVGKW
jgi:hypothetical protein